MSGQRHMIKPPTRPVKTGNIPEPERIFLKNGIPVYIIDSGTEEIERLEFSFGAGNALESMPLLSSTTSQMLTEGTEKYKSAQINRMLDTWSAYFHSYTERDRAGIVIYILNKHIDKILDVARDILFHPVFPADELKPLMKKRYKKFLVEKDKVNRIASDQFFESIFGKQHPYGRQVNPVDFGRLDPSLLRNFHSSFYRPDNMAVFVSGKIHKNISLLLDEFFGNLAVPQLHPKENTLMPVSQKERLIHIEKKDAIQSAIKIGKPSINKRHQDYHGLKMLNLILGGYFGSRLMKNIREDKGYTYGINSSVISLNLTGFISISSEVSNKFTRKAIDEIYKEIRRLQVEPVNRTELSVARNYMLGELVRMFDGPFESAESFRSAWEFGFDNSYYRRFADKIKTIGPDELMFLAGKYYNIDELYEVTAG